MPIIFNVHENGQTRLVSSQQLHDYALMYGLNNIAEGRYSSLFVLNLMMLERVNGVDPSQIIEELKCLEYEQQSLQTKPATQFKRKHLKGLWHKHFLPPLPSAIVHNILNHCGKDGIKAVVEQIFDPEKSKVVTREMIVELADRLVFESMDKRGSQQKLTGEWIIFAKENNRNYYLGIWPHTAGDESIASSIKSACVPEFTFLAKYFS